MAKIKKKLGRIDRRLKSKCGDCTLCCNELSAPEIGKDAGARCEYECEGEGCLIHKTKPAICREFTCLYRLGSDLVPFESPDKVGYYAWLTNTPIGPAFMLTGAGSLIRKYIPEFLRRHEKIVQQNPHTKRLPVFIIDRTDSSSECVLTSDEYDIEELKKMIGDVKITKASEAYP